MASLRLLAVETTTTAQGTAAGLLALATTVGMTRHAILQVTHATGGWVLEIVRVIDGTHVLARQTGFIAESPAVSGVRNPNDLTVVPNGASVFMTEQWVADLYSDDAPLTLANPVK